MTTFKCLSRTFTLCLVAMLGLFSSATASTATSDYSGEELVRGIFLADGVVADQLPGLREFSTTNFTSNRETQQAIGDFHDQVIAEITRSNPSFFESFKQQIDSRKHATIRSAIESGKYVVLNAMDAVNRQSKFSIDAETAALAEEITTAMGRAGNPSEAAMIAKNYMDSQEPQAIAPSSAIAVSTASVAVATRVAVAFYTEYFFWPENLQSAPSNNRIFQETIINAIAKNL